MDYDTIKLLGLQPDELEEITTVRDGEDTQIFITLKRKKMICPFCGGIRCNVKDYTNKKIAHSVFNFSHAFINYRKRRYVCKDCGKIFSEEFRLAIPYQKISNATVIQILKDCKRCNYTFTSIAEKNGVSPSTVVNVFDQYIDMKPGHLPRVLSIDEFYKGRKWKDKFACMFIDWETGKIMDIYPSRKKYKLHSHMQYVSKDEFKKVEYVSIDMNDTYRKFAHHFFKKATVMADSFHVVKNINDALRNLRIHVMYKQDKDSVEYYLLKKWNHLIMKKESDIGYNEPKFNKKIGYYVNRPQILQMILDIDPRLEAAYRWKEDYLKFNSESTYENAGKTYDELYDRLVLMNINEFKDVVSIMKNWRTEIMNSFIMINGRRISNGPIESINGRVKIILKNAYNFQNFERMRNKIMYCINRDAVPNYAPGIKKTNKVPGKPRGKYKKKKKK